MLLGHVIWRSCRDGGSRYFKERLGYGHHKDKLNRIHIHAASVGEVITVLPLVEKMQLLNPALALLITTNTPTGSAIIAKRLPANTKLAYLPIDFSGATKRFFSKYTISNVWIVETEIWPWLFARAKQRGIAISIINARLSHKSSGALANFFEHTYAHALTDVLVLARSDEDAKRYSQRGAQQDNISVIGNLKFGSDEITPTPRALLDRAYVLAASTHDDEELQLAKAWLSSSRNALLVLAPRHAERGAKLLRSLNKLQKTLRPELPPITRRSAGGLPDDSSELYLADTLGELTDWYAHATAAFVGGSLIARGGHNVLEAARVQTPIIVGPHTFNFVDEIALLQSNNAVSVGNNADEIIHLFMISMTDAHWTQAMGERAKNVTNAQNDIVDHYIASLQRQVALNLQQ